MLAITENAAGAIRDLMEATEMPAGGGLRIDATEQQDGLELQVANEPGQDDTVVADGGANIFLAPAAAEVLDDKVLDVQRVNAEDGQPTLQFAISTQPGTPG
jgi:Fe-S cluster assembly iron-binding protein IscA